MDPSRLDILVGRWSTVASGGVLGDELLGGAVDFSWGIGGAALIQQAIVDAEVAPDVHAVIVPDGDGFLQHYFDSRGIVRLYRMRLDATTWTLQRDEADFSPLPFHQRFVGTLHESVIDGRWERSDDGRDWQLDFHLRYERGG